MPKAIKEVSLEKWHKDEEEWWERNGEYMTFQWRLTPKMSHSLRSELDTDYKNYLVQPGGRILDLGCGSGWLSLYFAERGMHVLGLDISSEQISAASAMAKEHKLENASFEVADFSHWDATDYFGTFDSVFVSAFLHHLPEVELRSAIEKIASVVKPGGRVYLYEPLQVKNSRTIATKIVDRIYNLYMRVLLDILPNRFNWWSEEHKAEISRGYTMNSPHESPVSLEILENVCKNNFKMTEITGWHLNSLGFGMQTMGLKESVRRYYEPLAAFNYWLDRQLMKLFGWKAFSTPGRFILIGIKMTKL